jgi:hypothetical protein
VPGASESVLSRSVLATFTLGFNQPGSYPLNLDFFNTFGPSEDIFVTGSGTVLDPQITFGSTLLQVVIPEPQLAALLCLAICCLAARRRPRNSDL